MTHLLDIILLIAGPAAGYSAFVIYGEDNRQDLHEVQDPRILGNADSTVALFQAGAVDVQSSPGQARLSTVDYGQADNLCPEERFRDQPKGAFCSGALVAEDLVLTAGHCVRDERVCRGTKFVFGFGIRSSGADPTNVPAGDVYGCAGLVAARLNASGADFAVVRLDRSVSGRAPLRVNRSGMVAERAPLYVIGHPCGIPAKVAGGAAVRGVRDGFFTANLDTYGGNSGSPVFNAQTGEVEGILVRGDRDFVYDRESRCMRSNMVPDDGGRGEDVTAVAAVLAAVPELRPKVTLQHRSASGTALDELYGIQELYKLSAEETPPSAVLMIEGGLYDCTLSPIAQDGDSVRTSIECAQRLGGPS